MSEWISVKDRMPDEGVNVLTYGTRPYYGVIYINRLIDKDEWLYDGVTHWMPLPEPPEKPYEEWTDTELLKAAKAISENCLNTKDCGKCPFMHEGKSFLDVFCIVQEDITRWAEYIEDMPLPQPPKE